MIGKIVLIYFTLVNGNTYICDDSNEVQDKLIFAQITFRHGQRTKVAGYWTDNEKTESLGQLTKTGKQDEYELGQFFQRRYGDFIGSYSSEKLMVQSSDTDRTINSANLVLAGFFPPNDDEIWNEHLLWQPIPVHTLPASGDYFINTDTPCVRYLEALAEYNESPEIRELMEENKILIEYLEKHLNITIAAVDDLIHIGDALIVEYELYGKLPLWAYNKIILDIDQEKFYYQYYKYITGTTELKRLKSGFIIKEILDRFKNKTLSLLPDQLMHIYSGHDVTIASILSSLGFSWFGSVPHASSLLFELYGSNDNQYYIQIFFRNTTIDDLTPMNIPNCGTKCELNQFYELYNDILPSSSVDIECQQTKQFSGYFEWEFSAY